MKIGELARATQTSVETIRYYERAALLPAAPRSAANYRRYGPEHVERLTFVRRCRSLDMSLDEVRALLRIKDEPRADCGVVNTLLDRHVETVSARIHELEQLQQLLLSLRERCASPSPSAACGILTELARPDVGFFLASAGADR